MKHLTTHLPRLAAALTFLGLPLAALAHEGHGEPGTFGHDIQHQLWMFAALVVVAALVLVVQRRKE